MNNGELKVFEKIESAQDLKKLQRTFAEIIRRPLLPNDRMQSDERVERCVVPNSQLSAHQRLELYARQYWWRLIGSLCDDFPVVRSVLGKERFRSVVERYLAHYPSTSFTLRHLGKSFARFLLEECQELGTVQRLCSDIAQVEWAQRVVFEAKNPTPLKIEGLQVPPNELYLSVPSTVVPLSLMYPIHEIVDPNSVELHQELSNVQLERPTENGDAENPPAAIPARETYLVVHRFQYQIYLKEISKVEFDLLSNLARGDSLEESLANLGESLEKLDLGCVFQDWAQLEWLMPQGMDRKEVR
ncbi:MAG: putative DNA-binding domain-containing protein [Bdellovibrionales bacterium]|nr:putative DNA-binding domain-containing protein [Bdellovibrionales bacterium]